MPFAYDATIAMAHGIDRLLGDGVSPNKITADLLFKAVQQSTFLGATGKVSFQSNGDRLVDDLEFNVYNYHASTRDLQIVGKMLNSSFVPCEGSGCARLIFSDGRSQIPDLERGVRAA